MDRQIVKTPRTVSEALQMVREPGACFYAGGIELHLAARKDPESAPPVWVSLAGLGELTGVRQEGPDLVLGAASSYTEILESPVCLPPMLRYALESVGCEAIRNQGTVGGALATGRPFFDLLGPLVAVEAHLKLLRDGADPEIVPVSEYLEMDPGRKRTALVSQIRIPPWTGGGPALGAYGRAVLRPAMDTAQLSLAVGLGVGGQGRIQRARLVVGGHQVGRLQRLERAEALLAHTRPADAWVPDVASVFEEDLQTRDPLACRTGMIEWLLQTVQAEIRSGCEGGGGKR